MKNRGKTPGMRIKELEHGKPLDSVIREQLDGGLTLSEIADGMGVTRLTLRDWFERLGIHAEIKRVLVVDGRQVEALGGR